MKLTDKIQFANDNDCVLVTNWRIIHQDRKEMMLPYMPEVRHRYGMRVLGKFENHPNERYDGRKAGSSAIQAMTPLGSEAVLIACLSRNYVVFLDDVDHFWQEAMHLPVPEYAKPTLEERLDYMRRDSDEIMDSVKDLLEEGPQLGSLFDNIHKEVEKAMNEEDKNDKDFMELVWGRMLYELGQMKLYPEVSMYQTYRNLVGPVLYAIHTIKEEWELTKRQNIGPTPNNAKEGVETMFALIWKHLDEAFDTDFEDMDIIKSIELHGSSADQPDTTPGKTHDIDLLVTISKDAPWYIQMLTMNHMPEGTFNWDSSIVRYLVEGNLNPKVYPATIVYGLLNVIGSMFSQFAWAADRTWEPKGFLDHVHLQLNAGRAIDIFLVPEGWEQPKSWDDTPLKKKWRRWRKDLLFKHQKKMVMVPFGMQTGMIAADITSRLLYKAERALTNWNVL